MVRGSGGALGTRWLFETMGEAIRGDVLLNGEPSGINDIRFMEKGTLRVTVTVRTPGGHGGHPHLSPSAIKIMAAIIQALEALHGFAPKPPDAVARSRRPGDDRGARCGARPGGQPVGAAGRVQRRRIRGGRKVNQLPDVCELECDIRDPWGLTRAAVGAHVARILDGFPDASWVVTETHSYPLARPAR
jgi:acetylornithine deacetylase/succinyl-diaminopimelate desuccinylase-like protein